MKKVAIIFDSHDGHTQRISEKICDIVNEQNVAATLFHISECQAQSLSEFDIVVFGVPIRYGKHLPAVVNFLQNNKAQLEQLTTAFFSVSLTARKPHRNTPETSNYTKKLFSQLRWQPDMVEVFAGKLNYPIYRFSDRNIIRFIMWLTKGPTDTKSVHDFTNWQQVESFANRIVSRSQI